MATTYHQLGRVAQDRGELREAQDWYARSLALSEDLGNRPGAALTLAALGLLAEERGDLAGALEQMIRCVTQLEPFPHPQTRPGPGHLAR